MKIRSFVNMYKLLLLQRKLALGHMRFGHCCLKPDAHRLRLKRRSTCNNCVSTVWVFTCKAAAKAQITGRDDKTVLSRAFEILTDSEIGFSIFFRMCHLQFFKYFVERNDKHIYTTVTNKWIQHFSCSQQMQRCRASWNAQKKLIWLTAL